MNHIKNFDKWNILKKKINTKNIEKYFFNNREIWWASIGINIGKEIDGKNNYFERPVLIIKKINRYQFLGVPLTSKNKKGYLYIKLKYSDEKNFGNANLAQIRFFSSKRLLRKIGMVKKKDFENLKKEFRNKFLN